MRLGSIDYNALPVTAMAKSFTKHQARKVVTMSSFSWNYITQMAIAENCKRMPSQIIKVLLVPDIDLRLGDYSTPTRKIKQSNRDVFHYTWRPSKISFHEAVNSGMMLEIGAG